MSEISSASEEQSTGIEQVNRAVTQMDEVTQQNAALVEEASAAAQSMAQQAQALREAVAVFKVGESSVMAAGRTPLGATVPSPAKPPRVHYVQRTAAYRAETRSAHPRAEPEGRPGKGSPLCAR